MEIVYTEIETAKFAFRDGLIFVTVSSGTETYTRVVSLHGLRTWIASAERFLRELGEGAEVRQFKR